MATAQPPPPPPILGLTARRLSPNRGARPPTPPALNLTARPLFRNLSAISLPRTAVAARPPTPPIQTRRNRRVRDLDLRTPYDEMFRLAVERDLDIDDLLIDQLSRITDEMRDIAETAPVGECKVHFESASLDPPSCCQFSICSECMTTFVRLHVSEGNIKIRCPNPDCTELMTRYDIRKRLDELLKQKYERFLVDANKDPHRKTCPRCSHITSDLPEVPQSSAELGKNSPEHQISQELNKDQELHTTSQLSSDQAVSSSNASIGTFSREGVTMNSEEGVNEVDRVNSGEGVKRSGARSMKGRDSRTSVTIESSQDDRASVILRAVKGGTLTKSSKYGQLIKCVECKLEWCFVCQAPWHAGVTCADFQKGDKLVKKWAKLRPDDLQVNAQKCPKCKIYIQRSQGCDHMQCTQCNTEFCYRCGERRKVAKGIRLLIGRHDDKLGVAGCKYSFLANKPVRRKLVRGSILCAKLAALPVAVGLAAALLPVALLVLPVGAGVVFARRAVRRRRQERVLSAFALPGSQLGPMPTWWNDAEEGGDSLEEYARHLDDIGAFRDSGALRRFMELQWELSNAQEPFEQHRRQHYMGTGMGLAANVESNDDSFSSDSSDEEKSSNKGNKGSSSMLLYPSSDSLHLTSTDDKKKKESVYQNVPFEEPVYQNVPFNITLRNSERILPTIDNSTGNQSAESTTTSMSSNQSNENINVKFYKGQAALRTKDSCLSDKVRDIVNKIEMGSSVKVAERNDDVTTSERNLPSVVDTIASGNQAVEASTTEKPLSLESDCNSNKTRPALRMKEVNFSGVVTEKLGNDPTALLEGSNFSCGSSERDDDESGIWVASDWGESGNRAGTERIASGRRTVLPRSSSVRDHSLRVGEGSISRRASDRRSWKGRRNGTARYASGPPLKVE